MSSASTPPGPDRAPAQGPSRSIRHGNTNHQPVHSLVGRGDRSGWRASSRVSRSQQPQGANRAYTLTELMVIVAIIGILGVFSTLGFLRQQQDETVTSMAIELAGWLSSVQRAALRGKRCDITIAPAGSSLTAGSAVATATEAGSSTPTISNGCLTSTPLKLTSVDADQAFRITPAPVTLTYTPRGTAANMAADPLVLSLTLPTGQSRCLQIEGVLGVVTVGRLIQGSCQVLP